MNSCKHLRLINLSKKFFKALALREKEREREREREREYERVSERVIEKMRESVCVREREGGGRESMNERE